MDDGTKRAEFIAGLRAIADHYETHPDLPLPGGIVDIPALEVICISRDATASAVRALGGVRSKRWTGGLLTVARDFGGVGVKILCQRKSVCDERLDQRTGEYRSVCPPILAPAVTP